MGKLKHRYVMEFLTDELTVRMSTEKNCFAVTFIVDSSDNISSHVIDEIDTIEIDEDDLPY